MFKRKKKKDSELSPTDRILRNLMRPDGDLLDGSFINNVETIPPLVGEALLLMV